jgi:hypothetical protein
LPASIWATKRSERPERRASSRRDMPRSARISRTRFPSCLRNSLS